MAVSNVQVAQRGTKGGWEFDIFFIDLSEWIVFVAADVISDGLAGQDHEYVSRILDVNDVQY